MSVKETLKMGHPLLLQVAEPVKDFNTPELDGLIEDMYDTMAALNGAGLAAPNTVLINPSIEVLTSEKEGGWEGCLSVPGMRGLVPRYTRIRYSGFDQHGKHIDREATDFHARVVQHEVDHLDGILYPQRIEDIRYFGFENELFAEASSTPDE
jgi:peptide deformylase